MSCLQCYDWVWYFHALTIFSITPKRRKKIASDANSRFQFSAHKFNYSTHLKKVCQVIRSISKFHYRQFFGALVLQKRLIIENRKWGVKSKQNHLPPFFFNQNVWYIVSRSPSSSTITSAFKQTKVIQASKSICTLHTFHVV